MSNQKLLILTSVPEQTISINGKKFYVTEGILQISMADIPSQAEERSLAEFDRLLDSHLSVYQKIDLYELFSRGGRFGLAETVSMLGGIDRKLVKELLFNAFKCKLIHKVETQWRVERAKLESIQRHLKTLQQQVTPDEEEDMEQPTAFVRLSEHVDKLDNEQPKIMKRPVLMKKPKPIIRRK